ncbi:MAG: hypothetical protein ACOYKK_04510 [Microbacteriaceae bacterium]
MKVTTFTKLAIGLGVVALSVVGLVVPANADPSGPSSTALVGVGSDTTQDVMDEIAAAIGDGKLASYKSTIGSGQSEFLQPRPDRPVPTAAPSPYPTASPFANPENLLRAKGSGDGFKILNVAEGSVASLSNVSTFTGGSRTINKGNTVGQVDYARASAKQGNSNANGEYVNVPFGIDSVGIAVNPGDAAAKIPLEGLGATTDGPTKATVDSIFRCQAKYVFINNISVGVGAVSGSTFTKSAHGLAAGDRVKFTTTGALPNGLSADTNYYVKDAATNTFTVSATKTGAAVTTTSAGTGWTIVKTMGAANTYNSMGAAAGDAPTDTTAYLITPLIPGYGSGTASYFIGKIGRTEAAGFPASGNAGENCISRKMVDTTTDIQEHSGAAVAERENSMIVYSIGQWTSQTNSDITGATNRTAGTTLLTFLPVVADTARVYDSSMGYGPTRTLAFDTPSGHGLVVGDAVRFSRASGSLPTGIVAGQTYYVAEVPYSSGFNVSATLGGAKIVLPNASNQMSGIKITRVIAPTTGSGATLAPNENWTSDLKRVVYNVMPYRKAADPNNPLNKMFVGTNSLVCQQTAAIQKMGFTVLSSTDPANVNSCGSIAAGNRSSYAASPSVGSAVTGASIAALSSATAGVGEAVTTKVKIGTSVHQMGGTVQVLDKAIGSAGVSVLGSVDVAAGVAGDAETDITIKLTKTGTATLYAYFIPALGGVAVTALKWGGDAGTATTTLTASAGTANVSFTVRKPAAIGGSGRVIAIVQGPVAPGGTVELRQAIEPALSGVTSSAINTFTLANTAAGAAFAKTGSPAPAHALVATDQVKFSGTCPAGITVGTLYYVSATGLTTTAFKVSASSGGAVITTTAATGSSCVVTKQNGITVFTKEGHGLAVGNRVVFDVPAGSLPSGFVAGTSYFVATAPTANTFTLAATSGGAGIVATVDGAGTFSLSNTTPLASGTLSEGETAEVLNYTQKTASMTMYVRYVSTDGSLSAANSAQAIVSVPKLTPALAATLPAAPNGFVAGTAPALANAVQWTQVTAATATIATATETLTLTGHGLTAGQKVTFTGTALPGGIVAGTEYWVRTGTTATTFTVSATDGGAAVDITSAGTAVKVFKYNVAPKVTLTATAPTGATAKPSGSVRVFIGASATDRSREISVTGATLANAATGVAGAATVTLTQAAVWSLGTIPTAGKTVYLILDYSGDGVYAPLTLVKTVKVTTGR